MSENTPVVDQQSTMLPPPVGNPYGTPSSATRKKRFPAWAIVLLTLVGVLVLFGIGNYVVSAISPAAKTVGVIDIDGTIGQDDGANTPEGLLALLQSAENDPQVVAVVLRVNSGGGTAAAGEEMACYVEDFSKPIVVSTAASNASAAYLISSQADYIYANEASAVGAIGTAMQLMDYSQLLDLLGIDAQTITSAESKDATYGYRSLTDEERAYFQAQVDQINKNFIKVVAQGRGMTTESVEKLATGLSFTGEDAVENGLIDEIGTYQDACTKAASMAGVCSYRVESLGSSDVGLVDLLAALLLNTSDTNSTSNTEIQEGASVNGQLS